MKALKRQLVSLFLLGVCAVFLAGCFSPVKTTPVSYFTLQNTFEKSVPKRYRAKSYSILVSIPVASPAYNTQKMIYMNIPYKISAYANHEWTAPPAHLLLPLIAGAVRSTGYFHAVMTPPFSGRTRYQLVTKLLAFQQEFFQPVSQERVVIEVSLIDMNTNRVIASKVFKKVESAPENDPYSGVLAANKAANLLAHQIAKFVVRTIS